MIINLENMLHYFRSILILSTVFSYESLFSQHCTTDYLYIPTFSVPKSIAFTDVTLETRAKYVLPVVFHVVWKNLEQNISDELIINQLERLNLDFNTSDRYRGFIPKEFEQSIGTGNLLFCLAAKDPQGNTTSGITRTQTQIDNIGSQKNDKNQFLVHYNSLGGKDAWDTEKYINIWICGLENSFGKSSIGGMVLNKLEDGIVLNFNQLKTQQQQIFDSRTLTHEMGHYLGLKHLWGMRIGDCDEDDGLQDTPFQSGPYFDCPSYPQSSCKSNDMTMNFMDFVLDHCMHFFTKDQVNQMHSVINQYRPKLIQTSTHCAEKITEADLHKIKVYQKNQYLVLDHSSLPSSAIEYFICNSLGQVLNTGTIHTMPQIQININFLSSGIYFAYFRYNNQKRTIKFYK